MWKLIVIMAEAENAISPVPGNTVKMFIKKHRIAIIFLLILIIAALILLHYLSRPKSDYLFLSGRLEGYETDIAPKYGGKVIYVVGREGKSVRKNELLVKLDDSELRAQLMAAEANLAVSRQQERQSRLQLDIVRNQILQAQLNVTQSTGESHGLIAQAQANYAAAQTQLLQAQSQLIQAGSDLRLATINYNRYRRLLRNGSIARQVFDQAQNTYNIAVATVQIRRQALDVSRSQINAARGSLTQAQTSALNPSIRRSQVNVTNIQLKQAISQLEAAQSNIKRSLADRQLILAQISYLNIRSPINGVIIARTTEPGEIVSTGRTLLTLLDYRTVYLRGYIPEGSIGLVRVGQKARIFLDSAPKTPIPAKVSEIDTEATFTPENIYFRNDRVKQVFGVKLNILNPEGYAKPGMPADADIYVGKHRYSKKKKPNYER
jgi:HlyD family secretion protein